MRLAGPQRSRWDCFGEEQLEAVFPYSLMHRASEGLEAGNKLLHEISAIIGLCGGICDSEKLPVTFQHMATHYEVTLREACYKRNKAIERESDKDPQLRANLENALRRGHDEPGD